MKKRILCLLLSVISIFSCFTCISVVNVNATAFTPRTTAPATNNAYYYSLNPFYKSGYGMPNCTCYAYGRGYELLGSKPNLSTGNAGEWWWYNKNKGIYDYGSTPKLGAIACWDNYDKDTGHVAVVEAINGSSIKISESHYKSTYFDTRTIKSDSSDYLTSKRFLGYIYIGDFTNKNTLSIKYDANGGVISGSEVKYNKYKVTSSAGVNIRKGAGSNYSVIDTIPQNSTFVVTSTKSADSYTWGKTTYDGKEGWCVISEDWTTKVGTQPATAYYLNSSGLVYISSTGSVKVQKMIDGEDYPDGLYNCSTFGISRAGYTFKGWGTTSSGGTIYSQSEAMTAKKLYSSISSGSKTITLYAIWEPIGFTIKYNSNGGSGAMANTSAKYKEDFTLSSNKFTKTGYTFSGWNVYRSSDKTWYCSGDGWKTSSEISSNNFTKRVYSNSWSGNLNDSWMNSNKTKDTITFYAIWKANTLSVYYNANGGSVNSDTYKLSNNLIYIKSDSSKYIQKWTYNNKKTNGLANASSFGLYRTGYLFEGWSTAVSGGTILNQNNTDLLPTDISTNIKNSSCSKTLYAVWTPKTYTISYDANGGSESPVNQTKTHDVSLILSDTIPVREGYIFLGWSTSKEATNVKYKSGQEFASNANTVLYAVWEKKETLGDVNVDGIVNILDATVIQKYSANLTAFSDDEMSSADVNADGIVNVLDATLIQKYTANLITEF